ncbi:hypothetical protein EON65_22700 [archaeon]|nr:MAG: hypothetical protein EON65_22700 [archaeon]
MTATHQMAVWQKLASIIEYSSMELGQSYNLMRCDWRSLLGEDYDGYRCYSRYLPGMLAQDDGVHIKYMDEFSPMLLLQLLFSQRIDNTVGYSQLESMFYADGSDASCTMCGMLASLQIVSSFVTGAYVDISVLPDAQTEYATLTVRFANDSAVSISKNNFDQHLSLLANFIANSRAASKNSEREFIIHLLQQISSYLDKHSVTNAVLAADMGFSSYVVHSLVGMGANHLAASHLVKVSTGTATSLLASPSLSVQTMQLMLSFTKDNVGMLVQTEDVLHLFFTVLSESMHPLILDSAAHQQSSFGWIQEVVALRSIAREVLSHIEHECLLKQCVWSLHTIGGVARGLFLQAYMGLSLIEQTDVVLQDTYISSQFLKIFTPATNHHLPTSPLSTGIHQSNTNGIVKVLFAGYSFSRHSVGRLLSTIICSLANDQTTSSASSLEIYVLSDVSYSRSGRKDEESTVDDITLSIMACIPAEHWITLPPHHYGDVFTSALYSLHELSLDVVVYSDIAMQSSLLFWTTTHRIAPIQVLFWGHPYTSAAPTIDYFITAYSFEDHSPMGGNKRVAQFSEQLVQFDSMSFLLALPEPQASSWHNAKVSSNNVNPALDAANDRLDLLQWLSSNSYNVKGTKSIQLPISVPACSDDIKVYGSLQTLMKMHPLFDLAIADILTHDPCGVVVLSRTAKQSIWHSRWRHRLIQSMLRMKLTELDMARVIFVDQSSHARYSRLLCSMDVALDPFPFGGGVTLCDAVAGSCSKENSKSGDVCRYEDLEDARTWCQVPFVTLGELQSVHRIGSGIASKINNSNLAIDVSCDDLNGEDDYAERCIDRYARQAVVLARQRQRKERKNKESPAYFIYTDPEVAREWRKFLYRVAQHV